MTYYDYEKAVKACKKDIKNDNRCLSINKKCSEYIEKKCKEYGLTTKDLEDIR